MNKIIKKYLKTLLTILNQFDNLLSKVERINTLIRIFIKNPIAGVAQR
jgi:hypothetical protein